MRRAALTDVSALPIHILIWFLPDLPLRTIVLSAANGFRIGGGAAVWTERIDTRLNS